MLILVKMDSFDFTKGVEGFGGIADFKSAISAKSNFDMPQDGNILKPINEKLTPIISNLENVLDKTEKVTTTISSVIPYIPIIITFVDIAVILIYLGLIIIMIINPTRAFGIEISRNIYSSFYLTCTVVLFVLTCFFANPVLNNIDKLTSESPAQSNESKAVQLIDKVLSIFNKIINISVVPVMVLETIYMVLLVFMLSFMFIIASAMVRTYFALQCKYDQKIRASWWAYLIDVIMYCFLFIFAAFWVVLYIFYGIGTFFSKLLGNTNLKWEVTEKTIYYVRRLFLITVVYYLLKVIFSGLEYGISNNIIAISKWDQPLNECQSPADAAKNKKPEYIFYLFLNIMLCICIWLLIIALLVGHIVIYIYASPYISKANKLVKLVTKAFMFVLSGMVTLDNVEKKIKEFTDSLKTIIPGGIPEGTSDVVNMAKKKVETMLASNPNINVDDFLKNINIQDLVNIGEGLDSSIITKKADAGNKSFSNAPKKEKPPLYVDNPENIPTKATEPVNATEPSPPITNKEDDD